jgi:predicted S18 family serine protease
MRLLFCAVLVVAPLAAAQKSLKPISAPREATVRAVYFKGRGADATGGTTRVSIRLSPNKSGESSVGVMEEFSGGTGAMWRTATWQAAIGASAFNKVPLTDYEFLVRVGGHIDGPSAGLLVASTFVALQRGKALKPNTTMTGTINPDGSSGPVGGIVQKMRGAAADGVTRFGFPSGGREQLDMTTGERVDLLALAQQLKIEAKELRTLGEAYEFLTGDALPPGTLLPESELELTVEEAAGFKLMLQKVELDYQKAFDEALPVFRRAEERDPKFVKAVLEELSGFDERARKFAS